MANIILDVDGTLWDSTEQVAVSWNKTLQKYPHIGKVVNKEELSCLFGKPVEEIFKAVFPHADEKERAELCRVCSDEQHEFMYKAPCHVYEGVLQGIAALSCHHKLYIVSNCLSGYIDAFLYNTRLQNYISDFLCMGDTQRPKGENIRTIMQRNNLQQAVYVGDTQGDYEASVLANVPMIFAAYGFGNAPNARHCIHSFTQLLTLDLDTIQNENS